jgi:hypothetical protein
MTFTNKLPALCAAMAALAATSMGFGQYAEIYSGTVQLSTNSNNSGGDGEFTAFGLPVPAGYSPTALYQGSLETFCVEDSTYFWQNNAFGTSYAVSYSNFIQYPANGPYLGDNSVPYASVALNPDVAWLYAEFATGGFTGDLVVNTNANAGLLQDAIWELQGAPADPADPTVNSGNPYVIAARLGVAHATAGALAANFDVQVMNLYLWGGGIVQSSIYNYTNGGNAAAGAGDNVASGVFQNQLIYDGPSTPPHYIVPDGGMTIALFGAALIVMGFGVSRRRLGTSA